MQRLVPVLSLALAAAALTAGCAQMGDAGAIIGEVMGAATRSQAPLDETTVGAGLREALATGASRAGGGLSRPGAFGSTALRLRLPQQLSGAANLMRQVGLGSQVEALENSMNAAAESAAGAAVPVFADAVRGMTLDDAWAILRGGPDSATKWFSSRTSDQLAARFAPIARDAMNRTGLYKNYQALATRWDALALALPIEKPALPNLEEYVSRSALDAIWGALATEEERIRRDPAARASELLRRVFASPQAAEALRPR